MPPSSFAVPESPTDLCQHAWPQALCQGVNFKAGDNQNIQSRVDEVWTKRLTITKSWKTKKIKIAKAKTSLASKAICFFFLVQRSKRTTIASGRQCWRMESKKFSFSFFTSGVLFWCANECCTAFPVGLKRYWRTLRAWNQISTRRKQNYSLTTEQLCDEIWISLGNFQAHVERDQRAHFYVFNKPDPGLQQKTSQHALGTCLESFKSTQNPLEVRYVGKQNKSARFFLFRAIDLFF